MEELGNDVSADDRFPIRRGNHELDLNDPEVKPRVEEKKRRVFAFRDKLEKAKDQKENSAWIRSGQRNSYRQNIYQNQNAKSEANPILEMKNGAWTPMHFDCFSAVRQYDNHRLFAKENGLDPRDMASRKEFVRLLMESGTVDPFKYTQDFIKKQTEEARKNNTNYKRKSHERFPICKGYHELDLNDPNVRADIEETRRRVFAYRDKLEKEDKEKTKEKENGAWIKPGHRNSDRQNQNQKAKSQQAQANPIVEMKNGAWTPMHFDRFSAVREYENHKLISRENGLDIDGMASRTEFVRLLLESGTVDPFQFTQNFIKKQTEEARKNNISNKRKSHDHKDKGKKVNNDMSAADRFPLRTGYHNLDLNNPNVRAYIEEQRKKVSAFLEEKARELEQKQEKRRRSREEARKNNKRKTHDHKDKGKKMEELGNDVSADDRFPIRRGNHELDLNDPEVKARIEEKKERRRSRSRREEY